MKPRHNFGETEGTGFETGQIAKSFPMLDLQCICLCDDSDEAPIGHLPARVAIDELSAVCARQQVSGQLVVPMRAVTSPRVSAVENFECELHSLWG